MVFDVSKASDWNYKGKVEIRSIEELILFMEFHQEDVIIRRERRREYTTVKGEKKEYIRPWEIEIYDGYVE